VELVKLIDTIKINWQTYLQCKNANMFEKILFLKFSVAFFT